MVLTFTRVGRNKEETEQELNAIKRRKKGEPLSIQNKDELSEHLFTFQEMNYLFQVIPTFLEDTQNLLLRWCEQTARLAHSLGGKPRLRRR